MGPAQLGAHAGSAAQSNAESPGEDPGAPARGSPRLADSARRRSAFAHRDHGSSSDAADAARAPRAALRSSARSSEGDVSERLASASMSTHATRDRAPASASAATRLEAPAASRIPPTLAADAAVFAAHASLRSPPPPRHPARPPARRRTPRSYAPARGSARDEGPAARRHAPATVRVDEGVIRRGRERRRERQRREPNRRERRGVPDGARDPHRRGRRVGARGGRRRQVDEREGVAAPGEVRARLLRRPREAVREVRADQTVRRGGQKVPSREPSDGIGGLDSEQRRDGGGAGERVGEPRPGLRAERPRAGRRAIGRVARRRPSVPRRVRAAAARRSNSDATSTLASSIARRVLLSASSSAERLASASARRRAANAANGSPRGGGGNRRTRSGARARDARDAQGNARRRAPDVLDRGAHRVRHRLHARRDRSDDGVRFSHDVEVDPRVE